MQSLGGVRETQGAEQGGGVLSKEIQIWIDVPDADALVYYDVSV